MMGAHLCSCLVWMENEVAEKEILAQQGGKGKITNNPDAPLRDEMTEGVLHTGAEDSIEVAGYLRMKWNEKKRPSHCKKHSTAIVFPSLYWLSLSLSSEEYFDSLLCVSGRKEMGMVSLWA